MKHSKVGWGEFGKLPSRGSVMNTGLLRSRVPETPSLHLRSRQTPKWSVCLCRRPSGSSAWALSAQWATPPRLSRGERAGGAWGVQRPGAGGLWQGRLNPSGPSILRPFIWHEEYRLLQGGGGDQLEEREDGSLLFFSSNLLSKSNTISDAQVDSNNNFK